MVVLCKQLGSNKIISLYTSCTRNVVCYFDHEMNIEFERSSETSAILGICRTPKFLILGCAWKTLNKINDFNIYIIFLRLIKLC
jgi:hypothetical protein